MANSADQPIMNQPVTFQVNGTFTTTPSMTRQSTVELYNTVIVTV